MEMKPRENAVSEEKPGRNFIHRRALFLQRRQADSRLRTLIGVPSRRAQLNNFFFLFITLETAGNSITPRE